mmetsp:Transcript_86820/g.202051  ORF Transcript_86820/g.202051 Transcript_86820/m.202051 type:complete len:399 (+) Transcript_86820:122-1318(+)
MGDLSNWGAGANILKGLIGLGVLTLPYVTKLVGWLPSLVGMALIALLSLQSIFFAVMSRVVLEKTQNDDEATPLQKLPDSLAGLSCFDATVQRALGPIGLAIFMVCVALAQLTTVVAYLDVLAESAESYVENDDRIRSLSLLGVVVCLLSLVKTLSGVSVLSYVGLSAYGLVFLTLLARFLCAVSTGTLGGAVAVRHKNADYATWFGVSAFAFGALPVSLVVYDDMREPAQFFKVVAIAYVICWLFYSAVALLGFWCYGRSTHQVIYFNFESGSFGRNASLLMICLVLLVTYVLQMMPLYRCAEVFFEESIPYQVVRTMLVVFTLVVAYFIPSSTAAMTLGGTFAACISAFVLPPVVYLTVHPKPGWSGKTLAIILIVVGTAGAGLGICQFGNELSYH